MKATQLIKLFAAFGIGFSALLPAHAGIQEDARKVYEEKTPSVLGVKGVLTVNVTMNGQPGGSQEKTLWSNGVVVSDGLVAVAYRTIKPNLAAGGGVQPGIKLESELSEIKLVDASGEEYDAKLVLHDEDLGLAFVAINPEGDNAKDFKAAAIDLSKDVKIKHLDELVALSRMPEKMRSVGRVTTGQVSAIVERPRTLYLVQNVAMSNPVFTSTGEFVGLTVALKNSGAMPVVIPAKYIRKVIGQAKEKQAELGK